MAHTQAAMLMCASGQHINKEKRLFQKGIRRVTWDAGDRRPCGATPCCKVFSQSNKGKGLTNCRQNPLNAGGLHSPDCVIPTVKLLLNFYYPFSIYRRWNGFSGSYFFDEAHLFVVSRLPQRKRRGCCRRDRSGSKPNGTGQARSQILVL